MHIERTWEAVPSQLAETIDGGMAKFKFKGVIPDQSRYRTLAGPIDWLIAAGLIIKIPIAYDAKMPLKAFTKENSFKLALFDVGILGAMSGLDPKKILDYDYGTYKGYFAENFVAQTLLSARGKAPIAWQRGRAEVEFVLEEAGELLPIEVKSGWVTKAKSLEAFVEKYAPPFQSIMSAKPLSIDRKRNVHRYPLYLAEKFPLS